jgi:hypothetical protein
LTIFSAIKSGVLVDFDTNIIEVGSLSDFLKYEVTTALAFNFDNVSQTVTATYLSLPAKTWLPGRSVDFVPDKINQHFSAQIISIVFPLYTNNLKLLFIL